MESADPCRISYRKQCYLGLELLEIVVALASEVKQFVGLRAALHERLQWLYWVPRVLLFLGIIQLLLDICFTLQMAVESRLR